LRSLIKDGTLDHTSRGADESGAKHEYPAGIQGHNPTYPGDG
jgi:hypothetical protein